MVPNEISLTYHKNSPTYHSDSILAYFGENLGGHSSSDKSLSGNEGDMTIQGVYDLCLSLCKQVSDQAKEIQACSVKAKIQSQEQLSYTIDHMEIENAQNEGRTRNIVDEDKKIDEVRLGTEDIVSTDKQGLRQIDLMPEKLLRNKTREEIHNEKELRRSKEVDYEILDKKYPIKEWKTECFGTKPQSDQTEHLEEINLNVVIRSNGQKRYFSTLMSVLSIFDREDLDAVNQLVINRFQDEMPEGFDRVLWGDLMVLFNSDDKDEFWGSQQDWKIESWKLHSSSGVHTLVTDTSLVIHMLVEKKYPLRKEVLKQMLKLKLELKKRITMALDLIQIFQEDYLLV
ncbi:hypothetical protein Tco_0578491 [Tanacetum coccineum]